MCWGRRSRVWTGLLLAAVGLLVACTGGPGSPIATTPGADHVLLRGGWFFGECRKGCSATATIGGSGLVEVRIQDSGDQAPHVYVGQLTPEGYREATTYSTFDVTEMKEVFGCPDCADGGAGFLTSTSSLPVTIAFEYGRPPTELRDAFSFVDGIIRTVITCGEDPIVVATPPFSGCHRYSDWSS